MKKIICHSVFVVLFYTVNSYSQEIDPVKKIEADAVFIKTLRLELNSLMAIENFLYFSQGIDPLTTSDNLDYNLALAESYHTDIELFNRKNNYDKYIKISGYWQNLRLKVMHSYKRNLTKSLLDKLTKMHHLTSEFKNELIQKYKLSYTRNQLMVSKSLYYTHFLSYLYLAMRLENETYFKMILQAELEKYARLIGLVRKLKFEDSRDRKRFLYLSEQMEKFYQMIESGQSTSEEVYQQVQLLHTNMYKWLFN